MLEDNHIEAYVKYNYFHQEQKKKFRENPFRIENLIYDKENDAYICPRSKPLSFLQEKVTISDNGYKNTIRQYQAEDCTGCPLITKCHKAKGNRLININGRLIYYMSKVRELLM